ncbi:MAG: alpha/beta fold hydrolase [Chlamydiae bacterium]|nr:alpha/beta fold hydrolase [Chlamydiota bacterium]
MSNFVLVHGGMVGGWCWKKVRKYLEAKGHLVRTPTLTGLGERKYLNCPDIDLDVHINDIVNVLQYEELEEVILVGHSYGGMVITGVADRTPQRIKQLIYIEALIPEDGESMFDIIDPSISSYLLNRAKEEGEGYQVPPAPAQSYNFENPEDIKWIVSQSTPHPLKSFQQKITLKNSMKNFIRQYIKCTQDHFLDSMFIRAKNKGFICKQLDTGHFPMVTEPEMLSNLLVRDLL